MERVAARAFRRNDVDRFIDQVKSLESVAAEIAAAGLTPGRELDQILRSAVGLAQAVRANMPQRVQLSSDIPKETRTMDKITLARELTRLAKQVVSGKSLVAGKKRPSSRIKRRLEYLREQIENENISYGEIAELEDLADYIDEDDVMLLEWAGVPER